MRRVLVIGATGRIGREVLAQQPNPGRVLHAEIERLIEGSASEWTFLRPGIFAANAIGWWAQRIRAGADTVRWPFAAAPTAPIHERDVAAGAVRALCEEGHAGAEYVLTGPESLSQSEQVAIIGDAVGRPLRLEELTPEAARTELATFFPPVVMTMLFDAWAAALGQPAFVTSTVDALTGTPARTFAEWAADRAAAFRP